ncbi:hypothetical protein B0T14DRAFT_524252 [Immersiella caudata]|uniref:Secreted protein n=1 Tax=Immersiella caudata TaxID=314043 RepID=A0AA39WKH9_9PEZI|nr:hypothetical protein B0T14DRAFT_524252 [Immersiella caudata]
MAFVLTSTLSWAWFLQQRPCPLMKRTQNAYHVSFSGFPCMPFELSRMGGFRLRDCPERPKHCLGILYSLRSKTKTEP